MDPAKIDRIEISGPPADVRAIVKDVAEALRRPASEVEVNLALAKLRLRRIRRLRGEWGGDGS